MNWYRRDIEKFWDDTVKFAGYLNRTNERLVEDLQKQQEQIFKKQNELFDVLCDLFSPPLKK